MIIRLICSRKPIFLVNPSNPASHALSDKTLQRLKQVVEKNPNLIILTDDVFTVPSLRTSARFTAFCRTI